MARTALPKFTKRKGFRTPAEEARVHAATPQGKVEKSLRKVRRMVDKRLELRAVEETAEILAREPESQEPRKEHRTGRRVDRKIGEGINIPPQAAIPVNSNGRPAIYDPYRFPHIAYVLCKERGFTNEELARVFDVSISSVNQWIWMHEEFKRMVRRGRDEYDSENVENALRKRAIGYKYTETHRTRTKIIGKLSNGTEVEIPALSITTVEKEVAPDPRSAMYWLQNRQPERWKNTLKIEVDATTGQVEEEALSIEDMSTAELLALRDISTKAAEMRVKTIDIAPERQQSSVADILAAADRMAIAHQKVTP